MKTIRKIIQIDEELCDGCGQCVPSCAEGAIQVIEGKAKLVGDRYCDGLGACLGDCPRGALTIIEREADEFDEEAVEAYLNAQAGALDDQNNLILQPTLPCGCPSSQVQQFEAPLAGVQNQGMEKKGNSVSALSHWPVQIRLVPANAPFLKDAHLLVTADCTAVAYPDLHQDFLPNKIIMMGCPKFDSQNEYIQKFADIFRTASIKGVTILIMDVPCCQGLPFMVEKGRQLSGKQLPVEKVIINSRGEIIGREKQG